MKLLQYATASEAQAVTMLVSRLVNDGCQLSVFDGEEWVVRRSTSIIEVLSELSQTDMIESVRVRKDGVKIGEIDLLFQGCSNAMEVVIDYQTTKGNGYLDDVYNQIHSELN